MTPIEYARLKDKILNILSDFSDDGLFSRDIPGRIGEAEKFVGKALSDLEERKLIYRAIGTKDLYSVMVDFIFRISIEGQIFISENSFENELSISDLKSKLEIESMEVAIRESKQANKFAKIAIGISILTLLATVIIELIRK